MMRLIMVFNKTKAFIGFNSDFFLSTFFSILSKVAASHPSNNQFSNGFKSHLSHVKNNYLR